MTSSLKNGVIHSRGAVARVARAPRSAAPISAETVPVPHEHRAEVSIDDALEASFPASDPPAWNPGFARPRPLEGQHGRAARTPAAPPRDVQAVGELTRRVRAEYGDMPGLSVTLPQAQRLWATDRQTCRTVFMALTARGFLRLTRQGRFIRA